jgi:phosphoribosylformimino-5-aminoimidazole carboxamide ribotide isomerase
MDLIPVLDIRGSTAVAGQRGDRENYRPLRTVYSDTSDPLAIADALPFERLYVADLDGIAGERPDYPLLGKLSKKKKTMIDVGVSSFKDVESLASIPCDIILGTETVNTIDVVERSVAVYRDRVIVSVDIKDGVVLTKFLPDHPFKAVEALEERGVERIILLDISSVGTLRGGRYETLEPIVESFPSMELMVGGGITADDIAKMEKIGIEAVLVGTALHMGLLGI